MCSRLKKTFRVICCLSLTVIVSCSFTACSNETQYENLIDGDSYTLSNEEHYVYRNGNKVNEGNYVAGKESQQILFTPLGSSEAETLRYANDVIYGGEVIAITTDGGPILYKGFILGSTLLDEILIKGEIFNLYHPIFSLAVRDGYIRVNPTDGIMREIRAQYNWETERRRALTEEQQSAFVSYVSSSVQYCHWMPLFTVLLGTGGRIGEILGLRWQDCDFDSGIITIDHTLIYRLQENGKCEYHITTPKTKAGVREIPMFDEVRQALLQEKARQQKEGENNTIIDGYCGFIFTNRFGGVYSAHCVNRAISRIIADYNQAEVELAQIENRSPALLPHFSVHHLRHTFCSRMCENTSDSNTLKVIQEIMGHADISTTLDVYTDLTRKKKQNAFAGLQGKFRLR